MGLIVREKLTGKAPPPSAQTGRRHVARLAGIQDRRDLENLHEVIEDQEAFAKSLRKLISHLELPDEETDQTNEQSDPDAADDESDPDQAKARPRANRRERQR